MPEGMTPEENLQLDLDALEDWARTNATSSTQVVDTVASMAEIVLGLFETGRIGHALAEAAA